jgi:hypothetical protein
MILTIIALDSIEQLVLVMGKKNIVCDDKIVFLWILFWRISRKHEDKLNRSFFSSYGVQSPVIINFISASWNPITQWTHEIQYTAGNKIVLSYPGFKTWKEVIYFLAER